MQGVPPCGPDKAFHYRIENGNWEFIVTKEEHETLQAEMKENQVGPYHPKWPKPMSEDYDKGVWQDAEKQAD